MNSRFTNFLIALILQSFAFGQIEEGFPSIKLENLNTEEIYKGDIYFTVTNQVENVNFYIIKLTSDGSISYSELQEPFPGNDFKQRADGRYSFARTLAPLTYTGGADVEIVVLNQDYTQKEVLQMKNGYLAELHDYAYLTNGNNVLFGYYLTTIDLTEYGGHPDAQIAGPIIQELNPENEVIFQWRWYDNLPLESAATSFFTQLTSDPVHVNSITTDIEGNYIMSCLSIGSIVKVSRSSGDLMWTLGGKDNDFTFINVDSTDANGWFDGHDFRELSNGNYSFFDNSDQNTDEVSRLLEWKIDEEKLTAELIWEYIPNSNANGPFMGNAQELPNGNFLIGWGSASQNNFPAITEINRNGDVLMETILENGVSSYRSYKFTEGNLEPNTTSTISELATGNSYDFEGLHLSLEVEEIAGFGYNEFKISNYDFSPNDPTFFNETPILLKKRLVSNYVNLNSLQAKLIIEPSFVAPNSLTDLVVYYREFPDSGLLLPLSSQYNSAKNQLEIDISASGEYAFGYKRTATMPTQPKLNSPLDLALKDENNEFKLAWSPNGLFDYSNVQVSIDSLFNTIVFSETDLKESSIEVTNLNSETLYYWRVRNSLDGVLSEWSDTWRFTLTKSFITLISPNGSEQWLPGSDQNIIWNSNLEGNIIVELLDENENLIDEIVTKTNRGGHKWEVPLDLALGEYFIRINDENSTLSDQSDRNFLVVDMIRLEQKETIDISVYPNPAKDFLHVRGMIDLSYIEVFDLSGTSILTAEKTNNIDLRKLSSGVYVLTLHGTDRIVRKKVIIQ